MPGWLILGWLILGWLILGRPSPEPLASAEAGSGGGADGRHRTSVTDRPGTGLASRLTARPVLARPVAGGAMLPSAMPASAMPASAMPASAMPASAMPACPVLPSAMPACPVLAVALVAGQPMTGRLALAVAGRRATVAASPAHSARIALR
jgi:hypothetical protein